MNFWQGKFNEGLDKSAQQFISTFSYDKRLYKQDVMGSIAHITMLSEQGIINEKEAKTIQKALSQIFYDIASGKIIFDNAQNVYEFLDNQLTERIGTLSEKLNVGRTQTDRFAINNRMYVIELCDEITLSVYSLISSLIKIAEENLLTIMPSYYRGTKAQPTTLAHSIMAFAEMFTRDVERFVKLKDTCAIMPLYSAHGTGLRLPVDRKRVAALLNFNTISANSADAITDIDYMYEYVTACNLLIKHLITTCNTVSFWHSNGFVRCNKTFNVDSTVLPQSDVHAVIEALKTKSAKCFALTAELNNIDAKSLAYSSTIELSSEIAYEASNHCKNCVNMLNSYLSSLLFNEGNMLKVATSDFTVALDCVDYLILKGASKNDAYEITGKICQYCAENNKRLDTIDLDAYQKISPLFESDVISAMRVKNATRLRKNDGEPSDVAVRAEIRNVVKKLSKLLPEN